MITTRQLAGLIIDLIDEKGADLDPVSKQNALGQASMEILDQQKAEVRTRDAKIAADAIAKSMKSENSTDIAPEV